MDDKKHGNVIKKYHELNKRLEPYGLEIHAWGRLAIRLIEKPFEGFYMNNTDTIEEIEAFVEGLEFAKPELKIN